MAVLAAAADLLSKHFIFQWLLPVAGHTKVLIPGYLKLSLHMNRGAVWGIGGDQPVLLLLITAVIIPAVALLAYSCKDKTAPLWALGMLMGGAVGNLYDRIFTSVKLSYSADTISGVRDFVDMSIPNVYDWPVYNIADVAIVLGVVIYACWSIFLSKEEPKKKTAQNGAEQASTENSAE